MLTGVLPLTWSVAPSGNGLGEPRGKSFDEVEEGFTLSLTDTFPVQNSYSRVQTNAWLTHNRLVRLC